MLKPTLPGDTDDGRRGGEEGSEIASLVGAL